MARRSTTSSFCGGITRSGMIKRTRLNINGSTADWFRYILTDNGFGRHGTQESADLLMCA